MHVEPLPCFSYQFGGILLNSSIGLRGLLTAGPEQTSAMMPRLEFRVVHRPLPGGGQPLWSWKDPIEFVLFRAEDGWIFRIGSRLEFGINARGDTLVCYPGPEGWLPLAEEYLLHRILPRVVQLQGRFVLHGVALATRSGAVLVCGPSGMGKSTLAGSLMQASGWALLAENMVAVAMIDSQFWAFATSQRVRLWADSLAALSHVVGHVECPNDRWPKFSCALLRRTAVEAQPVCAIYELLPDTLDLCCGAEVAITSLSPQQRLMACIRNQIPFPPVDRAAEAQRLAFCAQLSRAVAVKALSYPRRYAVLPTVGERLAADLTASTTERDTRQGGERERH
jgi:hypothetical protein